jgi:type I restriction enzyme S subunit
VKIENRSHVLLRDITVRITKGSTPTSYGFAYQKKGICFIKTENIDSKGLASTISDYIDEETHQFLKRSILEADDVLFSIAGTIGRIGIVRTVDLPANTNQALAIIRPQAEVIVPKYLFHFLNSPIIQQQTKKKTAGVGRANVSLADVGEFEIWLPRTIEEQKRIVAEIEKQFSRLDEAVALLKLIQANLKRYKAAVLKAAVEGKLTEQWRKDHPAVEPADQLLKRILAERRAKWEAEELAKMKAKGIKPKDDSWKKKYKEPAGTDTANLPELPVGWVWASIEQLAILVTDGDHNPPKRTVSGIPHLTAKHVRNWRLEPSDCTYISRDDAVKVFKRYSPLVGDLIVTCVGTVGRTAIVPEGFEFSPDRNLAAVRLLPRSVNTKYVQIFLESPDIQKVLKTSSGSTAQPHLYLSDLRSIFISLPPLVEQNEIVVEIDRRLSVTEELETTIETNLKRAERLRQTILQQAFSGGLVN